MLPMCSSVWAMWARVTSCSTVNGGASWKITPLLPSCSSLSPRITEAALADAVRCRAIVRLAARREILRVLGARGIQHLRREVGGRLPRREPLGDVGNSMVPHRRDDARWRRPSTYSPNPVDPRHPASRCMPRLPWAFASNCLAVPRPRCRPLPGCDQLITPRLCLHRRAGRCCLRLVTSTAGAEVDWAAGAGPMAGGSGTMRPFPRGEGPRKVRISRR